MSHRFEVVLAVLFLSACGSEPNYSIIRVQMPGAYTTTTVQLTESLEACFNVSRRFVEPIKSTCPQCQVDSSKCEPSLSGQEKVLWSDAAMDDYSVTSESTRVLFSGPRNMAKAACERTAAELSKAGRPATCTPPGQPRKS